MDESVEGSETVERSEIALEPGVEAEEYDDDDPEAGGAGLFCTVDLSAFIKNWENVFSGVGLTAKTIPCWQCVLGPVPG